MNEPNLNDLRVFVEAVDSGGFTAAARQLGAPPSTVSRRVARLERRLATRLLHRTTRTLRLTDAGQRYYERGKRVLEELEDAERELAQLQGHPRGRVRVAAPLEHSITMRLVSRFLLKHPDVKVELFLTNRFVDLFEDGFDVSIQPGTPPDKTSLLAFKLMDSAFRLVASPEYLTEKGEPASPPDLAAHDCIMFGTSVDAVWSLSGASGPVNIPVRGRLAVNHLLSAKDAATSGLGIAMLPAIVCDDEIRAGRLRVVLSEAPPPPVPIWVTHVGGRHISPAVRAFVDFAREQFLPTVDQLYGSARPSLRHRATS